MNYTANKRTGLHRAIVCFLFGVLALGSVLFPVPVKAGNNYIDQVVFYNDIEHGNRATLKFHCKVSFSFTPKWGDNNGLYRTCETSIQSEPGIIKLNGQVSSLDGISLYQNGVLRTPVAGYCGDTNFTAGYDYDIPLSPHWAEYGSSQPEHYYQDVQHRSSQGYYTNLTEADYITGLFCSRVSAPDICLNEIFYLTEFPTINITFPLDNAEISGAFNVEGSYTLADSTDYDRLRFLFMKQNSSASYPFDIIVAPPGENIIVPISGIPAGVYDISIYFFDNSTGYSFQMPWTQNISILNEIPYQLPGTGEQIPISYTGTNAIDIYPTISPYATPTALYIKMTDVISPLINSIGENLNFFSGKFTQESAIETGQNIGGSILLARAYVGNINSFFNDFPVANLFLMFLLVMVGVIVFRLVKGLIGLIKL